MSSPCGERLHRLCSGRAGLLDDRQRLLPAGAALGVLVWFIPQSQGLESGFARRHSNSLASQFMMRMVVSEGLHAFVHGAAACRSFRGADKTQSQVHAPPWVLSDGSRAPLACEMCNLASSGGGTCAAQNAVH